LGCGKGEVDLVVGFGVELREGEEGRVLILIVGLVKDRWKRRRRRQSDSKEPS
jgi:hypothetical protein